ncbi:hypothetical protein EDD11_010052, partial [Mortierella claussenii]
FRTFRIKIKVKAGQGKSMGQGQGQDRTLFNTVFIAEIILEGHNIASPIDQGVMFLEPVNAKDDGVVLELSDFQGQGFMVVSNGQLKGGVVGDGAVGAGRTVSHVDPNGLGKGRGWKLVHGGEGRVDKGLLSA